ncbi:MAG: hypothetical protein OIF58_09185 [Cohaesibacter sp.]|nr:hypothetical protein [Cohaesibacter sp.]
MGKRKIRGTRSRSVYPGPSWVSDQDANHTKAGPVIRLVKPAILIREKREKGAEERLPVMLLYALSMDVPVRSGPFWALCHI